MGEPTRAELASAVLLWTALADEAKAQAAAARDALDVAARARVLLGLPEEG